MNTHTPEPPFPCPFCGATHVALVGSGLVFLHYKCGACAEVWTAMAAPRPAHLRPAYARPAKPEPAEPDGQDPAGASSAPWPAIRPASTKFWRN